MAPYFYSKEWLGDTVAKSPGLSRTFPLTPAHIGKVRLFSSIGNPNCHFEKVVFKVAALSSLIPIIKKLFF